MRTFFALRHMGSVLWVTDQVPWSHSRGGGLNCSRSAGLESLMGARRLSMVAGAVVGSAILSSFNQ